MKEENVIRRLCLLGVLSLPVYILHEMIGRFYYPQYNWMRQAVSDLTAVDAPSYVIANGISSVYALFACVGSLMVCLLVQNKLNMKFRMGIYLFTLMNFVSAVGYALFPLSESGFKGTFQDIMHVYVVTILVVLLSLVSLILIIIGGKNGMSWEISLRRWAVMTLILMLIGPIGMGIVPADYFGVVERISVYSAVLFNLVLGVHGYFIRSLNL